jgi:hypothetical protein
LTRAYFTAATSAISLFKILSIALIKNNYINKNISIFKVKNTPPQFLSNNKLIFINLRQRTNIAMNITKNINKHSKEIIL